MLTRKRKSGVYDLIKFKWYRVDKKTNIPILKNIEIDALAEIMNILVQQSRCSGVA